MNVWLLTNTPSPYQVELFSAIPRDGRCNLVVRFMRQIHRGQLWRAGPDPAFRFKVLCGMGPSLWSDAFRFHPGAFWECLFGKFDLFVLSGQYTSLTFVACAFLLCLRRQPWVMWLEQPWPEDYRPLWTRSISARSRFARSIRARALSSLLRHTHRVFCIGTSAVEAYHRRGASPDKLVCIPYCCNTDRYRSADAAAVRAIRERYHLDGKTVFLFSGQLIERKGVDILLRAFGELAKSRRDIAVIILGDGPLRQSLDSFVSQDFRDLVHFVGHVEQSELPPYFHAAHVFVLPSRHDGWGVVINEACAAGLPVISTSAAGAARDLVVDGVNGFVLPRDDVAGLTDKMSFFVSNPDQVRVFGDRSKEKAAAFSVEHGAELFRENAEEAARKS
jgi:glycosyltransferase involved in cell wall biosynthesis